jgi:SAM-dependent methyltransferase
MNPELINKLLIDNSNQQNNFREEIKGRIPVSAVSPASDAARTNLLELDRLTDFLRMIASQTYPESPSLVHSQITRQAITRLGELVSFQHNGRILDVGCGQGPALSLFQELGLLPVGITINEEDLAVCRRDGFNVINMDQSFLDFSAGSFDLIWARHVVEHSIFPLFTLTGFNRVLKEGGVLYLEVPAPDTACHHERNPNHYSMLPKSSWISLLQRSGFQLIETVDYQFCVPAGDDVYWGFYCRKLSIDGVTA